MANRFEYREARTPTSRGKVLDHIVLRRSKDGFTVERHYQEDGYMYHAPSIATFGLDETAELQAHINKHAKIEDPVPLPAEEDESAVDEETS